MKLFLDSSTAYLYLSVKDNKKVISYYREGKCDHSETLVDCLNKFLSDNKIDIKDIDSVYIGRGPGSYTGLRIAGTVGKVFSYLRNVPLYSFSSLDSFLAKMNEGLNISLIDAKKNHSYYKIVEYHNGNIKVIQNDSFDENSKFESYNATIFTATSRYFDECGNLIPDFILNNSLYKEESNMDYSPNYIRSGI